MAKVTGGELPAAIWHRFMTVAEKDYPSRDFPWLVPEPPGSPESPLQDVSETTTYEDEPDVSGPPGHDMADGDDSATYGTTGGAARDGDVDEPPPREDDRAEIDSGRGPVVIRGGHYSSGSPPRGYYDPNGDAPPPGRGDRTVPDRAAPERGWRDEPPDAEQDQEAPPPRRHPPPQDSSADDDPRYRY
jgi:membrane peptidoglycan carboxypeptidase